ncbi:MAG: sporulation protein YabP [Oscillospiraceae bacterium]|nr:sporulation protein YabP [Oscillospiraceae bacterium]
MITPKENAPHNLTLHNRVEMTLTGILDVMAFDEMALSLQTTAGMLNIDGEGLQISKLDVNSGEMHLEGTVRGFYYIERTEKKKSFFRGRS